MMTPRKRRRYDAVKRILDILGAAAGAVVGAPLLAATAVVVAVKLGRPVLFRQRRLGRDGRVFEILKFRTMLEPDRSVGRVVDLDRMTPTGSRIRSLSLDELPSLWNVLKGDMSIVGPRPLGVSYLPRYSPRQSRRHEVRPGLTGLAQVSGRNALPWDARLELDVRYVENRSLRLDLSILLRTVGTVLRRDGITAEGEATMSEFFGPMSTERLELVELSPAHLRTRAEWFSSPMVCESTADSRAPDLEATEAWLARAHSDPGRLDWVAVDRSGEPRAMCGLTEMSPSSAELYLYVGPDFSGQGYDRETVQLAVTRARSIRLRELRLQLKRENVEARRMLAGLGFRELGEDPAGTVSMTLDLA